MQVASSTRGLSEFRPNTVAPVPATGVGLPEGAEVTITGDCTYVATHDGTVLYVFKDGLMYGVVKREQPKEKTAS